MERCSRPYRICPIRFWGPYLIQQRIKLMGFRFIEIEQEGFKAVDVRLHKIQKLKALFRYGDFDGSLIFLSVLADDQVFYP